MPRQDPDLLKLVNASGFLLQLRLEEEIHGLQSRQGWEVIATEHHWVHPETGESGYIDLIVGYGIIRLVIECKRPRGGSWVFLTPAGSSATGRTRCLWSDRVADGEDLSAWEDFIIGPGSPAAAFCIVAGQSDKDQPMLERLADSLLDSVEALAAEELQIGAPRIPPERRIYVPMIVTTATLEVCEFDPAAVDLDTGVLPDAQFQAEPWVRFRKGLAQPRATATADSLQEANREKERTVLVVKAGELGSLLRSWAIKPATGERWPFIVARELADLRAQRGVQHQR